MIQDQWKRKKQTPEQKRAARKAKLDPDNWKSARDVLDEREAAAAAALKRKREEGDASPAGVNDLEIDLDLENPMSKKRKLEETTHTSENRAAESKDEPQETEEQRHQRKREQKAAKRARQRARKEEERQKKEILKAKKREKAQQIDKNFHGVSEKTVSNDNDSDREARAPVENRTPSKREQDQHRHDSLAETDDNHENAESREPEQSQEQQALSKQVETPATIIPSLNRSEQEDQESTATSSEGEDSPILSPHLDSGISSISSIQPSMFTDVKDDIDNHQPQHISPEPNLNLPQDDPRTPRERLGARISQFRAERKADGPDGRPARNRQELLDERRRKEEQRRAAKKEQRQKEKEEERRRQDEEIAKRFSPGGSGSLLASPRSPIVDSGNNFTFGRVAFGDGTQADASLTAILDQRKKKGPSDPASALKAVQNKAAKLADLDETKRHTIEEQDMWLKAKRKAHGERVRDDTSLLKKALKRKEGEKRRSEKEWQRREEGVRAAMEHRQQKREENIQKRKDEKNDRKAGGKKGHNKVKRPGFEGSFRGRTGGKKRKSS